MGLGSILSFGGKLIDAIFTGKEDRDKAKQALALAQLERSAELEKLAYERERELIAARREAVVADAKGQSWLQRNWRPVTMMLFVFMIGAHWFGFTPEHLSDAEVDSVMRLLAIGIGGFVFGDGGARLITAQKKADVMREQRKQDEHEARVRGL